MPYERKEFPYALRTGVDLKAVSNLQQACNDLSMDLDFMMIDLCHASNFRDAKTIETRDIALARPGK